MIMKRKIYVVGGSFSYVNWMEGSLVENIQDADLVVFTGGEDVSSYLYNEPAHPYTSSNTERDKLETKIFAQAIKFGKHICSICRGSQLTCVVAGGKLVQHQDNPSFIHPMTTIDGKIVNVSSTHHQAQSPWNLPSNHFTVLGWTVGLSKFHEGGNREEMVDGIIPGNKEVEICHYPVIKALAIQSHPEMIFRKPEFEGTIKYMQGLLNAHMET